MGRLVGTHGVRGGLRVSLYNPDSTALADVERVFFDDGVAAEVLEARPHGRAWLVRLDVASSPEAAKAFVGREILVDADSLAECAEGEFYHFELVGSEVVDEAGERVGVVREILVPGGNDVLVIDGESGECMVPITKEFVAAVDLEQRRIVIRPIPGLLTPTD